jgi:hypothetical protein
LFNHLDSSNSSSAVHCPTLFSELISHGEHPDLATICVPDKDKVTEGIPWGVTQNMIRGSSSKTHTTTIVKSESASRQSTFAGSLSPPLTRCARP